MRNVRRITPRQRPILTVDYVRAHSRIDGGAEDGYLAGLIQAATEYLDGYRGILHRALINQTWAFDLDTPLSKTVKLPLPDAQSAIVTYGGETVDPALYSVDGSEIYCEAWPTMPAAHNGATVEFVCGYGPDANDVPEPIKLAALHLVAQWYENREAVGKGMLPLPSMGMALLSSYRALL